MKRTLAHGVEHVTDVYPSLDYYYSDTADRCFTDLGWTPAQLRVIADDIEAREREAQRGKAE